MMTTVGSAEMNIRGLGSVGKGWECKNDGQSKQLKLCRFGMKLVERVQCSCISMDVHLQSCHTEVFGM